jgi:hypothetical protein
MWLLRVTTGFGFLIALLAWAPPSAAFCRTSSCELDEDERAASCERDDRGCVTEGNPLHWPSPCVY